jgi:hypothetical protein
MKAYSDSVQNKITTRAHALALSSTLEHEIPVSGWSMSVHCEHRVESLNLWDIRFIRILFRTAVPTSRQRTCIRFPLQKSTNKSLFHLIKVSIHPVYMHIGENLEFRTLRKELHERTDKSPNWNHTLSKD